MTDGEFEERLMLCHEPLFGYAVALTRDRDLAADLVQDCIVRAVSAQNIPEPVNAFRSWMFAILRNLWLDRLRAGKCRTAHRSTVLSDEACEPPVAMESVVVNVLAVRQAMRLLSDEHRDVLGLVDIAGFSYRETADILSIPHGTVMSRVARARIALCDLLSDDRIEPFPAVRRGDLRG